MKKMIYIILIAVCTLGHAESQAQTTTVNDEALAKTQNLLKDKQKREEFIKTDSAASTADKNVTQTFGDGKTKEDIYDTSAIMMKFLTEKYSGDPEKMQQEMTKAMSNPKEFLKSLPADIQNKIKRIADEHEAKSKKP